MNKITKNKPDYDKLYWLATSYKNIMIELKSMDMKEVKIHGIPCLRLKRKILKLGRFRYAYNKKQRLRSLYSRV